MEEITSVNNTLVKETVKLQQKKYRNSEDKFLLEGFKPIAEAFDAGIELETIFVRSDKIEKYKFFEGRLISTTEAVLGKISTTETPPEAVGVAKQKHYLKSDLKAAKKVILLENIKDLGNLGTILRTAVAFGVDGVVLFGDCADLYNPKTVRSSVGNLWKIPVVELSSVPELKELFSDFQRVATLPLAKSFLKDFGAKEKILVMFGSEADGLSEELKNFATTSVKIEMSDKVESLNLSVSCAVVLYKIMVL